MVWKETVCNELKLFNGNDVILSAFFVNILSITYKHFVSF